MQSEGKLLFVLILENAEINQRKLQRTKKNVKAELNRNI